MDYRAEYQKKLVSAAEAVKVVKSGDWVDYSFCANHPVALDKALAERMAADPSLTDINFRGAIALWPPAVTQLADAAERITWNSWHTSGIERKLIDKGFAYYNPLRYSEMPRYYRENIRHLDVLMMQVAPMDEHGYFNFGLNASQLAALVEVADTVIVEVNQNMPVCLGGHEVSVHIDDVTMVVEGDNPPVAQMPGAPASAVDEAVAKLIVPEIPNGACLQLGIGGMPNAVGSLIAQSDLKDLGVHTEMYVDAFVDIAMAGKITGANKAHNKGRQVYTFAAGTQKLYDYINNNPACMAAPVDYVNDVRVISELDNFMSINNAVEVDLFGQVASESSGTRHISGAGGQLDFVLGAYLSKGGKSFICCSSTVKGKDGSVKSRLAPTITPGGIITATRANIHYLVTEYGLVNLKGTSTWERAEKIISVAHPDFRDQLIADAEKMHIWRRSNKR
ncbi:MAG: butyryl-CoA:acetate CoA-transferase [Oscillospiraceae bacterium]|nr:butyryl-CoA:acetate CoA-transferase [Oscillospiraceae bacterium]